MESTIRYDWKRPWHEQMLEVKRKKQAQSKVIAAFTKLRTYLRFYTNTKTKPNTQHNDQEQDKVIEIQQPLFVKRTNKTAALPSSSDRPLTLPPKTPRPFSNRVHPS